MAKVPNAVEKIAENYNRLSRVHERYRRQTDDRRTGDSNGERERKFTSLIKWPPVYYTILVIDLDNLSGGIIDVDNYSVINWRFSDSVHMPNGNFFMIHKSRWGSFTPKQAQYAG